MRLQVQAETCPLARAFMISRGANTKARVVTVTADVVGVRGRSECVPCSRFAPAVPVARGADIVDLDGALLPARDSDQPLLHDDARVHPSLPELWE